MKSFRRVLLSLILLLGAAAAHTQGKTELTWYGHSAFKIVTPEGHVLLIDPWITNPSNPNGKQDLASLTQVDLILITHAHFDHVGDAVAIAKKTGARLVTTFDLGQALVTYAGYPAKQVGFDTQGNFGGTIAPLGDDVQITFVPAVHSSDLTVTKGKKTMIYPAGNPGGFLIQVKDGPTLYHTGDTDLFSDMALIPQKHPVDVMLTCIGDHFTMGPEAAAQAVKLVNPKEVIPMHFATFPVLTGTPEAFQAALTKAGLTTPMKVMKVDETLEF